MKPPPLKWGPLSDTCSPPPRPFRGRKLSSLSLSFEPLPLILHSEINRWYSLLTRALLLYFFMVNWYHPSLIIQKDCIVPGLFCLLSFKPRPLPNGARNKIPPGGGVGLVEDLRNWWGENLKKRDVRKVTRLTPICYSEDKVLGFATYGHTVDENANQQSDDNKDEKKEDDPFVSPPDDVFKSLERRREP